MKFDDILLEVGEFGRYQKVQYLMICFVGVVSAWHALNMVFLGAKPEYHCRMPSHNDLPDKLANLTHDELQIALIPNNSKCSIYNTNDTEYAMYWNASGTLEFEGNRSTYDCPDGWTYSRDVYASTIVSSYDLVCTNEWLRSTSKSLYFVGRLLGAVIFGHLSDRFGRRPCFFIALAMQTISGILISVSPHIVMFLIFYVCQGIAQVGVFLVAYTIGNELVAPRYRFITGMGIHMFYSIGYILLAGIAYGISEWRYIELAITLPGLLFVSYWWLLPESVRWLLSQGRNQEAITILKKVAATNKKELKEETIERITGDVKAVEPTTNTAIDLLKRPNTAVVSLNVWLACYTSTDITTNRAVNSMVYYGLSLNTNNLGGSPYLNFCIAGAVELPAYVICVLVLDRIGRRIPLVAFMLVGGVTCIVSGFMPKDMMTLGIVLAMIGKFAITASYVLIYLIGAEVFPTTHRFLYHWGLGVASMSARIGGIICPEILELNAGLGVASMSARIGGIICPQILELNVFYRPLPLLVFGVAALGSGLLCVLLPETMGRPLPQTLDDMGRITRKGATLDSSTDGQELVNKSGKPVNT